MISKIFLKKKNLLAIGFFIFSSFSYNNAGPIISKAYSQNDFLNKGDTITFSQGSTKKQSNEKEEAETLEDKLLDGDLDYSRTSRKYRAIALSNIAEGIYKRHKEESKRCNILLDKVIDNMLSDKVCPLKAIWDITKGDKDKRTYDDNFYLTHLNIALGIKGLVEKDKDMNILNKSISVELARRISESKKKNVIRNNRDKNIYPSDNSCLLYSLFLYDKANGSYISQKPANDWISYMKDHGSDEHGLHFYELSGSAESNIPRGSSLSRTVYYMSYFAPFEARELWENYKEHFLKDYIFLAGLREWPDGYEGHEDITTGPIVSGIGVAATALGLRAAKGVGDEDIYDKLRSTRNIVEMSIDSFGTDRLKRIKDKLLSRALDYNPDRGLFD